MTGIVGFTPNPEKWMVRRCPIHEIVPADEAFCPVLMEADSSCGLDLSEPFEVALVAAPLNQEQQS